VKKQRCRARRVVHTWTHPDGSLSKLSTGSRRRHSIHSASSSSHILSCANPTTEDGNTQRSEQSPPIRRRASGNPRGKTGRTLKKLTTWASSSGRWRPRKAARASIHSRVRAAAARRSRRHCGGEEAGTEPELCWAVLGLGMT